MANPLRDKLNQHASKSGRAHIEARATDLFNIYANSRDELERIIFRFVVSGKDSYIARQKAELMEEIQAVFPRLEEQYREAAEESLHYLVQSYYRSALSDLSLKNKPVGGFVKNQVDVALDDLHTHIAGATRNMSEAAVDSLRRVTARVNREAKLTGESKAKVTKRLIVENGGANFLFTDAKGTVWNTDAYFDMLSRTLLMNNAREAYLQACADQGSDIVVVSFSGNPCPKCAVWEGRLLSISGKTKGLPTLAEAIAAGLFHPNCTHNITAVPPEIAETYYHENGRPVTGLNSPGNEESDDPDTWKQYRFQQRKKAAKQAVPKSLGKSVDHYYDGLTDGQKNLIKQYTNADEKGWNRALRNGNPTEEQQKEIDQLSDVLAGFPKYQGDVWRGVSFDTAGERDEFVERFMKSPESLAGFTSTTVDFKSAEYYSDKYGKAVKVFIKVQDSTCGAYVGHTSYKPGDKEALFDHKIKFQPVDLKEIDGILYITAKELLP